MTITLKLFDNSIKKFVTYDLFNVKDVVFIHSISKATLIFKDGEIQDVSIDSIDYIKAGVANET